jgi:hypothetical protein
MSRGDIDSSFAHFEADSTVRFGGTNFSNVLRKITDGIDCLVGYSVNMRDKNHSPLKQNK